MTPSDIATNAARKIAAHLDSTTPLSCGGPLVEAIAAIVYNEIAAAAKVATGEGAADLTLETVLWAAANFISCAPDRRPPDQREAVLKGLGWAIEQFTCTVSSATAEKDNKLQQENDRLRRSQQDLLGTLERIANSIGMSWCCSAETMELESRVRRLAATAGGNVTACPPDAVAVPRKEVGLFGLDFSATKRMVNRLLKPYGLTLKVTGNREKWGDQSEVQVIQLPAITEEGNNPDCCDAAMRERLAVDTESLNKEQSVTIGKLLVQLATVERERDSAQEELQSLHNYELGIKDVVDTEESG